MKQTFRVGALTNTVLTPIQPGDVALPLRPNNASFSNFYCQ